MAKISIIIPVHNTAPYLKKCVESVLSQTIKDIEVILAENLSSDGSYELCNELALADNRIKVLHLPVAGPSYARNRGIETATSQYIGFVDSDDTIDPQMYESLYKNIIRYNADIATCNYATLYEDGTTEYRFGNSGKTNILSRDQMMTEIMYNRICNSACVSLYSKKLFDYVKFPEGYFFEDHATYWKFINLCQKCVHIDKAYYTYYQRTGSICHTLNPEKFYHFFLADYGRLQFITTSSIFSSKDRKDLINRHVFDCTNHFLCYIQYKQGNSSEAESDMRHKLIQCICIHGLSWRWKKRILQYIWPLWSYKRYRIIKNAINNSRTSV